MGGMSQDDAKARVVLAGGSGFLGRGLTAALVERGYAVTVLSRSASGGFAASGGSAASGASGASGGSGGFGGSEEGKREGVTWRQWDAKTLGDWAECLEGAAAIVNLVGRSVDCRKTAENQRVILESRVDSCRVLGEAMRAVERRPGVPGVPGVWVQAGTAHIVGDPEPLDTVCDESTPPGPQHEMAPRVGVAWERAFEEARLPEQRGVVLRISFVLGAKGGALARLSKATRLGLGGTVGSGDQWISWIHQNDLNRLIIAAIEQEAYRGTYMVTAPEPVTNRAFMEAMRKAHGRPWSPPAPAMGVRLACRWVLDTDPELALLGRRCVPTRLLEQGFAFEHPEVEEALEDLRRQNEG